MSTVIEEIPVTTAQEALVRAGGNPYVLLSVVDHETGQVELISQGFSPEQIVAGLRETADLLTNELVKEGTK